MDDRHAQFLVIVAEASAAARVARLDVEVLTADGERAHGVPAGPATTRGDDEVDDTGYSSRMAIGDTLVALDEVVALTVLAPG